MEKNIVEEIVYEKIKKVVTRWKNTDKYPCPKCDAKLNSPNYTCEPCKIKLKVSLRS